MNYHHIIFLSAALALGMWSCRGDSGQKELAHNHNHAHENADQAGHSSHDGEILLAPEKGERFGVVVAEASRAPFADVTRVSGQILPSASETSVVTARSAGIARLGKGIAVGAKVAPGSVVATISARGMTGGDANESARVALEAARRELDRLTPLHDEGIVSTRDYNAARQRYDEARVAAGGASSGAGSAATAVTSGVITSLLIGEGQYVEAGQPIAEVAGSRRLTLRADLPEAHAASAARYTGATFRPAYTDTVYDLARMGGRRITGDARSAATGGYLPLYFEFDGDGTLVSGAYCDVFLTAAGSRAAVAVPREALSEQQGQLFLYVETHPGAYTKRPVTSGATDGARVEIVKGLEPGERYVAGGVTFVRLAETADVKPEGHTH